jgi:hypothetical protein
MKDKLSAINYCAIVHLVLFLAVVHLVMGRESMLQIMECVLDAFEIVSSLFPLDNANIFLDATTKTIAMKVLAIFITTATPTYVIGYSLFSRFNKIDS